MIIQQPGGGGVPCYTCQGTQACVDVRAGFSSCKVEADSTGRSCTASGRCGVGTPFKGVGVLARTAPRPNRESIALEDRINRYFHAQVIPTLVKEWPLLRGRGTIVVKHNYRRRGAEGWFPGSLAVYGEMLPDDDLSDDLLKEALHFMRRAVKGTSFPSERWDGDESAFVLYWGWPVPFPSRSRWKVSAQ
ncbi:MAG: hypothetical protein ACRDJ4_09595 [Actinomycetota bacterium]